MQRHYLGAKVCAGRVVYVDHWSLWLDLKIIALTVWKILKREGINQPGQATMEEFMGSATLRSRLFSTTDEKA